MESETAKIGKRGTVVIPSDLRRKYGFVEGSTVIAEAREEGVLLRPVVTLPLEIYTPERKAEFLLNNAVTREDYDWAVKEVRKLGIDPETFLGQSHTVDFPQFLLEVIRQADGSLRVAIHPDPDMVPTETHFSDGTHPTS